MHLTKLSRLYFLAAIAFLIAAYLGDNIILYVLGAVFSGLGIATMNKKENIPDPDS